MNAIPKGGNQISKGEYKKAGVPSLLLAYGWEKVLKEFIKAKEVNY